MESNSTTPAPQFSGRRGIAKVCSSRPISNANDYLLNHGTLTRIYSKVSKKERTLARRREKLLNAKSTGIK